MDIYSIFYDKIASVAQRLGCNNLDGLVVEPVKGFVHGDIATNLAILISKVEGIPLVQAADNVIACLKEIPSVASAYFSSGFVNIILKDVYCHQVLRSICETKKHFADCNIGSGEKINLEFISANPTGPLHIGHVRGAIIFDSLSKILKKVGFDVTKEYYINDFGTQIDTLADSVYVRYSEHIKNDGETQNLDGLYPGEYIKDIAILLFETYGESLTSLEKKECSNLIKKFAVDYILKLIKDDLKILNIEHDVFTYESKLHECGVIEKALSILKSKELVYHGFIDLPKGKKKEIHNKEKLLLFRSTEFGDDVDRSLEKDDGSWSYFASDLAYHYDKISRGFNKMIVGLGADHIGYVKRLSSIVTALSDGKAEIILSIYNTVNFLQDGSPLKLSKRKGNLITIGDITKNIDISLLKCAILTRKSDVVFNFDFAKFKLHSNDNPVFYVQYAYARTHSIMKKYSFYTSEKIDFTKIDLTELKHIDELKIIKCLAKWPRIIKTAARKYEPHRIMFYLQEVAELFHKLWHNGNSDQSLRFVIEDNLNITNARMCLVYATQIIIEDALETIGIVPSEVM